MMSSLGTTHHLPSVDAERPAGDAVRRGYDTSWIDATPVRVADTPRADVPAFGFPAAPLAERPIYRACLVHKNFQNFPSYRIFGYMKGALNVI